MKHSRVTIYTICCLFLVLFFLHRASVMAEPGVQDPAKIVVYRTSSGQKYHRKDCPTLQNSKSVTAITLEEALKQSLEACTVCSPPVYSGGRELYRLNNPPLRVSRDAQLSRMLPATVLEVVDGDTIKVSIPSPRPIQLKAEETIRFLGIDAPESKTSPRPAGYYGEEAKAYVRRLLTGKTVLLAFDWDLRDKYGRLLAYIFLKDGTCVNLHLVQQGYAFAYVQYTFQFMDEFIRAQAEAKQQRHGLWGR
jgi:micrococcal nuclease